MTFWLVCAPAPPDLVPLVDTGAAAEPAPEPGPEPEPAPEPEAVTP